MDYLDIMDMMGSISEWFAGTHALMLLAVLAIVSLLLVCGWSRRPGKTAMVVFISLSLLQILSLLARKYVWLAWLSDFVCDHHLFRFSWFIALLLNLATSIAFLLHVIRRGTEAERAERKSSTRQAVTFVDRHRTTAIALGVVFVLWVIMSLIVGWWGIGWGIDILLLSGIWALAGIRVYKRDDCPEIKVLLLFILAQFIKAFVLPCISLLVNGHLHAYNYKYGLPVVFLVYIEILAFVFLLSYLISVARGMRWKSWNSWVTGIVIGCISMITVILLRQGLLFVTVQANAAVLCLIAGIIFAIKWPRPLLSAGFVLLLQVVVFWPSLVIRVQFVEAPRYLLAMIFFFAISSIFAALVACASKGLREEDTKAEHEDAGEDTVSRPPELVLASRWKRLWGALLDSAIMLVIWVPFWIYFGMHEQLFYYGEPLTLAQTIGWALFAIILFLIVNGWLLLHRGQTLGKRIVGTRIVRENTGERLSFGSVYGMRYLLPGVLYQIPILSYIFAFADSLFIFGKRKRCIHDWFADSIVIDIRRSSEPAHEMADASRTPHILASRWKRLWGALLDSILILGIIVPAIVLSGGYEQLFGRETMTTEQTIFWFVMGVVVFLLLNGWLLIHAGQTLGKRIVGTRIVDAKTGQRLSFGSVYGLRYLLTAGITQMPVVGHLFALVNVLFIFGERKRCIHDRFAGSIVIDVQKSVPQRIDTEKDVAEQSASRVQESVANSSLTEPVVRRDVPSCALSCKSRFVRLESFLGTSDIRTRCVFFGADAQNATKENGDAMFLAVMQSVLDLKLPMPLALEYVQIHINGVSRYGTGTTLMLAMSVPLHAYDAFCEAIPPSKLRAIGQDGIQGNPPSLVNQIRNDSNPITCWYYQPGKPDALTPRVADGKYGFVDESGAFAITPEYDMAWPFFNGLARVKREGKCGFIDATGHLAIPLQFDDAYDFSEGYARFRSGELGGFSSSAKYGYIDPTGKVVIEAKYAYAEDVVGGKADVSENRLQIESVRMPASE